MQYRKFGATELAVSEVSFGAWAIGGGAQVGGVAIGWGNTDDAVSTEAIHAALDAGINFFDTADFYGLGHSEALLGRVLHQKEMALIATKVGHRNIDEKIVLDYSKDYIIQACEASLKRLRRDRIDYYQLHSARLAHLQQGECIEAMQQLKQQGKIRYWGLSLNTFHPGPEADYLIQHQTGDGFQLVFNLVNQRALPVMEAAAANGYGIIARMPLQFGLLAGKFESAQKFAADDHRSFRLTPDIIQKTNDLLTHQLRTVREEAGLTSTQLALSYPLSYSSVTAVIPGIRTARQVEKNTTGLQPLSDDVRLRLQSLSAEWEPIVQLMEAQG